MPVNLNLSQGSTPVPGSAVQQLKGKPKKKKQRPEGINAGARVGGPAAEGIEKDGDMGRYSHASRVKQNTIT